MNAERAFLLWQVLMSLRGYRLLRMGWPSFYPESGWTR